MNVKITQSAKGLVDSVALIRISGALKKNIYMPQD
jgi:hypothetical protein